MNLQHNKLWVAIALGILSGPSVAAEITCTVTPVNSIITEGQSLQLQASCNGALTSINWLMDGDSVTGDVAGDYPANKAIYYTTPVGLGGSNTFPFTVDGTTADPLDTITSTTATVFVKPSSAVVARAADDTNTTPTNPVDAVCGDANGTFVTEMPINGDKCDERYGTPALWISGPDSFTWSCLSLNGGHEANCSATRGYTVTATDNGSMNGEVSPASQGVPPGGTATVTATPATGYGTSWSSTCGGSASGNSFTTGAVNANCTVTASFSDALPGDCGTASGTWTVPAPTTNLCDATAAAPTVTAGTTAYTWTCTGTGGAANASCSAPRAYTVTASATNGSVSPTSKNVAYNGTVQITLTPTTTGDVATMGGTCPAGTLSGSTYTTGKIIASCTVTASFSTQTVSSTDPGVGKGLWVPPSMPNRTVADQSGVATDKVSYVPGCLNGLWATSSNVGCAAQTSYTGTIYGTSTSHTVTFGSGKQLVLRYTSNSTAGQSIKYIRTSNYDGGNIGLYVRTWLSTSPTATYDSVSTACKATSNTRPMIVTGPGYCALSPNTVYYYGIEYDDATVRRLGVEELGSDFY